jgi:hypothetical protein
MAQWGCPYCAIHCQHRLVFAKGIEGAELSGGAVIVSEGGRIGGEVIVVQ